MTAVLTWSGDTGKVCSHFELFSLWLPSLKVVPVSSSPSPSTFWQYLAAAPGSMSVGAVGAVGAAGAAVLGVSPVQDGGSQSGVNLFPCRLY